MKVGQVFMPLDVLAAKHSGCVAARTAERLRLIEALMEEYKTPLLNWLPSWMTGWTHTSTLYGKSSPRDTPVIGTLLEGIATASEGSSAEHLNCCTPVPGPALIPKFAGVHGSSHQAFC
jgi:hypothetical protein